MPTSKAQQKAVTRYVKNKYDRFGLTMPKGHLDEIKAHAEAQGQSVNAYINAAIDEKMAQKAVGSPASRIDGRVVSLPSEAEKAASAASEGRAEDISAAQADKPEGKE